MKLSNIIFIFIWYLPSLGFGYLCLSNPICGLNDYSSIFIAFWIYIFSVTSEIKIWKIENRLDKLENKPTTLI